MKTVSRDAPVLRLVAPDDQPRAPLSVSDELYQRYAPYVASIVVRLIGRRHGVEDLVQDVFVHAVRKISAVREPDAIRGWLSKMTVRLVYQRLRVSRFRRFLGLYDESESESTDQLAHPGISPEDGALLAEVFRVLDECTAADRVAWSLYRIQGETLERAAELCGCSLATVKRRIARTQNRIDVRFADE